MYRVLLQYTPVKSKTREEIRRLPSPGHRGEREMFVEALDTREHRAIRQVERMYVVDAAERFGVKASHASGQV
jgi:hypothetical protein